MIEERWSDSAGSYLRIRGDEEDRISDRILHHRCIDGICPMEIEHIDGHREYVYEVSGCRSLEEVMGENPLSGKQWVSVLEQLTELIGELEAYLLDGEHLVIREDTLWLQGKEPILRGIYVSEHREKLGESLGRLVEKVLRYPEYDRETSEFLYRLHARCVGETVTVGELRSFLRAEGVGEDEKKKESKTEKKQVGKAFPGTPFKRAFSKNESASGETHGKRKMNGNKTEKTGSASMLYPVLLIAVGVIIPVILMGMGIFTSQTTGRIDFTSLAAAFLFFGAAGGYGAWRLWPSKSRPVEWEEDEEPGVCLIPNRKGFRPVAVERFPWKLGRDERQCDAVIDEEEVSPLHACIRRESRAVLLVDQESEAGTYHNESRLTPWTPVRLKDGDRIAFGRVSYVVEIT